MAINHIHGLVSTTKEIDGKYYSFNKELTTKNRATDACIFAGGKLYEPKDKPNYDNILVNAKRNDIYSFWLGIIEGSKKGEFIYQSDRSPIVFNLAQSDKYYNDKCIRGNTNSRNKWYHVQCDWDKYSYVCEKNGNGKSEHLISNFYFKIRVNF